MNDTDIEREIQAKKLTHAPHVTPQDVESSIAGETYTVLPSGRTTVCELTMRNGFTVRGESSVVSIENFDAELGRKIAREDAKNKIWPLLAYALREQLGQTAETR